MCADKLALAVHVCVFVYAVHASQRFYFCVQMWMYVLVFKH